MFWSGKHQIPACWMEMDILCGPKTEACGRKVEDEMEISYHLVRRTDRQHSNRLLPALAMGTNDEMTAWSEDSEISCWFVPFVKCRAGSISVSGTWSL